MKTRALRSVVECSPAEFNREADRLANGVTDGFNPLLEMKLEPEEIVWDILPDALDVGREAERGCQQMKTMGTLPNRGKKQRRRDHQKRLRVVETS